ncbi:adenylosuccinate synthetase [Kitasatospora phosalacinea]|uniref:adenylosuccinate synthetase n=1 Tax=Kitasatospora phosalacinea TaxID=2065 RepID=UPI00365429FF
MLTEMTTDPARRPGHSDVLVGLQYGDEGKAKIIDLIAPDYDVVARFNGGANAGHTIDTPAGRVVLQQVPSAVFHPGCELYIGSGCVLNLVKLRDELALLRTVGVDLADRLRISDRCAVVQPVHFLLDQRTGAAIGTTGNGIGPCYADRAARTRDGVRCNLQLRDLLEDPEGTAALMLAAVERELKEEADAGERLAAERERIAAMRESAEALRPMVTTDRTHLARKVADGARVLFEGAQSLMLDVVQGDQPYVTSSHTLPGHAYVGGDLPPRYHRHTIGVAKAVVSRVGHGPFPSELGAERSAAYFAEACRTGRGRTEEQAEHDPQQLLGSADPLDVGTALRMLTGEYGSGTGRPRRIGLLDLEQLREQVTLHGVDVVYLNKTDCLAHYRDSHYGGVPVQLAAAAPGAPGSERIEVLPVFDAEQVRAAVAGLPGLDGVPASMLAFKEYVEQRIGAPVIGLGLGPERDCTAEFARPGALPAPLVAARQAGG